MKRNQFWTVACKGLAALTVTLIAALVLAPGAWAAGKYKVLYNFTGGTDGGTPWAAVTFDASGNLYGTTQYGGTSSAGTVFELVPNSNGTWTESVLYSFTGGSDGAYPEWC